MKRVIIVLLIFCWNVIHSAAFDFEMDGIYYDSLSSKSCEVVRGNGYMEAIVNIPNKVIFEGKEYEVVRIGSDAFYGQEIIENIHIPASVLTIGSEAFMHCKGLTKIEVEERNPVYSTVDGLLYDKQKTKLIKVPIAKKEINISSSVAEICDDAFQECRSLRKVIIPSSVIRIGNNAFAGCDSLGEIQIPKSVESIGEYAFQGCKALSVIAIPSEVMEIGINAISFCTSLKSVTLSSKMESIPDGLFRGCTSLTDVVIPSSVTSIGDYSFAQCDSLQEINIPNTVTSLGSNVFYGCSSLEKIRISESVMKIGSHAFEYCSKIDTIAVPSRVDVIGEKSFNGCNGLAYIDVSEENIEYKSIEGFLYDKKLTRLIKAPSLAYNDNIPASVTQISPYAYFKCGNISCTRIPESVLTIGEWAFVGCGSLDSVYMVKSIDLTDTYLPDIGRTLFVPKGNKTDFEGSIYYVGQYSLFKAIVEYGDQMVSIEEPPTIDSNMTEPAIYSLQGVRIGRDLNSLVRGVYIMRGKKVVVK